MKVSKQTDLFSSVFPNEAGQDRNKHWYDVDSPREKNWQCGAVAKIVKHDLQRSKIPLNFPIIYILEYEFQSKNQLDLQSFI